MTVRVRIAPSPTGMPHIGTIWQALINFSFAKKNKGKFIVRIEDTDRERYVKGAEEELFKSLKWFGLEADESPVHKGKFGPYRQSERLELYLKYAKKLVSDNKAYYCTCSEERLKQIREQQQKQGKPPMYDGKCRNLKLKKEDLKKGSFVIRLKVPKDKTIVVDDLLRGKIKFESNTIDDQVLIKSDGYPTYHLAVVVDDFLMKISHMVRAEEWLPSAPKNWLLYEALGWKKPVFVHTLTLRNPDKSKMSKRHGHTAALYYQERFLKEAILNYLGLLGWSHPKEKEIFDLQEFIRFFDLKDLSVAGPVFDINKLTFINGYYLRQKSEKELEKILMEKAKHLKISTSWWPKITPLAKERIKDLSLESINFWLGFFTKQDLVDFEDLEKDKEKAKVQLQAIENKLKELKDWNFDKLQTELLSLVDGKASEGWKRAKFFMYLRIAITGRKVSLPLLESMEILGRDESIKRVGLVLNKLN